MTQDPFLSAKWKHLTMINYEIDPSVLTPYIPQGTQLDLWEGKAYVSLVGFMFLDTRVKGFSIPFHKNFEEVNLRFYVKKKEDGRRGVVFIKEIVPRWAIAFVARHLYHENYIALPMKHVISEQSTILYAEYQWKFNHQWQKICLECHGNPSLPTVGSQEEFITEHYWGYNTQSDGRTMEYQVEHPQWRLWKAVVCDVNIDVNNLYGPVFAPFLNKIPASSFIAEGSEVFVYDGKRI